ncbi:MAG: ATP-binding protein [Proteobacteria bacterium]|nr:ATP-binding protein [Pseudomonadota bacterium]
MCTNHYSYFVLKEGNCSKDEIENVLIAGEFGEHLDIENFKKLQFIPDFNKAEYHFLGNTSLKEAKRVCMNKDFMDKAISLRGNLI